MKTRAIEFGGCCSLGWCDSHNDTPGRGGVAVCLDNGDVRDDDGEMICCDCASRLARLLKKRVKEVAEKQAKGFEYRDEKWRKVKRGTRPGKEQG